MGRLANRLTLGIFAAMVAIAAPSPVVFAQQNLILICTDQPNGPSGYQIELDYANKRVLFLGQWHAASFTDRVIQWRTPRHEPGTGEVRLAQLISLDRVTATISFTPECLPRDWDICRGSSHYCRPAKPIL